LLKEPAYKYTEQVTKLVLQSAGVYASPVKRKNKNPEQQDMNKQETDKHRTVWTNIPSHIQVCDEKEVKRMTLACAILFSLTYCSVQSAFKHT